MAIVPLNTETGEIAVGYITYSPAQQQARKNRQAYVDREKGSHWVASYHDAIRKITQDLSLTQAGAVIKLLPYLRFKSEGKLISNGKPLKQTEIQRIFKRSRQQTSVLLNELETLGIIHIAKEGRSNVFYISTDYHTMGSVVEGVKFTKLYQVKLTEVIEGLPLNDVGVLYKILPYFHYSEYYLCDNPDEDSPQEIRHLDRDELANRIGHDVDTVTRLFTKLRGRKAILTTRAGYTTRYLVHPDLMFRQQVETEWTRSVRKMFEQHD